MSTLGDFGTNEKGHYQISRIFVLAPVVTMQSYMLAFGTPYSLLKFLYQAARAQTNFLFHQLIKSPQFQNVQ